MAKEHVLIAYKATRIPGSTKLSLSISLPEGRNNQPTSGIASGNLVTVAVTTAKAHDYNYSLKDVVSGNQNGAELDPHLYSQCFAGRAKRVPSCAKCNSFRLAQKDCLHGRPLALCLQRDHPVSRGELSVRLFGLVSEKFAPFCLPCDPFYCRQWWL